MNKGYKKIILIEVGMILVLFFNAFILDLIMVNNKMIFIQNIYTICFWLTVILCLFVLVGLEKNKFLKQMDVLESIFIYSLTFLIITYLSGIFFGYIRSPYNLTIIGIIKNIVPLIIIIILAELSRFYIIVKCNNIRKNKYSQIILGLLILVYVLFDFSMNIGNISNMRQIGMIESMGLYIIPSIIKNIMLTYLVYKNGYRSAILYQLIFSCYIYLVPVFPDLGNYFESILYVIFPLVVLLKLINIFGKKDNVFVHRDKLLFTTMWTVMISFMIMLIILVSGLFKFYILTIASGSMEPLIKIGDVIIIEKLKEDDLKKLKVGDVLVHKKDKETVVHRIIEIKERYKKTTYRTKGDANNAADNYIIYESDIIGRAKFRVPLVGYPTVWLNQIVKEKG